MHEKKAVFRFCQGNRERALSLRRHSLSAWFVFSALGFYPNPGENDYWLACPAFKRASVSLPSGNTLTIRAEGANIETGIPKKIRFNGETLEEPKLTFEQMKAGGELLFVLD